MKELIKNISKQKKYRVIERDKNNQRFVKGTTFIDHKIRIDLGLTLREYVVCSFIHSFIFNHKQPRTFGQWFISTGFYPRQIHLTYERLLNKGVLFKDADGLVKTTEIWNKRFPNDSENFSEMWKLHSYGNKQIARKAFIAACKVDTFENIMEGLKQYIKWREETEQYPKHLSTFLNAKNKEWTTERNLDIYKKKEETPIKPDPNPKSAW